MFAHCILFYLLSTFALTLANNDLSANRVSGFVVKTNGQYSVNITQTNISKEFNLNADVVLATGLWDTNYNISGWSVLEIKTTENQTNIDQAYAAGLLEGYLTQELTNYQWTNNLADRCPNRSADFCVKLKNFLSIQLDWIYTQIAAYPNDEYWHQVNLLLIQLNGLIDGHANKPSQPKNTIDDPLGFFLFQIVESLGELAAHFQVPGVERGDSCSVLIKATPGFEDVFVSHADWSHYRTMLKVLKRYTMPFKRTPDSQSPLIPGFDVIFSSYPGTLHSIDDFYMMFPANLVVIETTINNYNQDLFQNILPISVPEWIRVVVANRLSNSGQEWVDRFYSFNDGTYNNEWMVTDFKKFKRGSQPDVGFLTVSEQMVTYSKSVDMTHQFNNDTYWASYNNVYFPEFRQVSGEDDQVKQKGPELYSWANSSRAQIFRRDHNNVTNITSMIHIMRYNEFQTDPLSKCNCTPGYSAELTIAARCDLNLVNGTYPDAPLKHRPHGATDAKITNAEMMQKQSLVAIAGPTAQNQTAFQWSASDFNNITHLGHPDTWNFAPFTPTWTLTN